MRRAPLASLIAGQPMTVEPMAALAVERFRAAEVRLERESLLVALRGLTVALEHAQRGSSYLDTPELRQAKTTAHLTQRWATNRQDARDTSRPRSG